MEIPVGHGPQPPPGDIAAYHEAHDPGPEPMTRAVLGILLGAAAGLLTVLVTRPAPPLPPRMMR